jgi:tetratricopeptide (TPR) repeat protein
MMKKILFSIAAILIFCFADAQLRTPAPSPSQTIKQDFGLSSIEISYSRPGVKGRKIFGDLVPFGKVWRTGANSATTINFGEEVMIGGTKVPAGTYGLLTIPDANEWAIIISKQTNVTSPADYKQDQDLVRVKVKPTIQKEPIETFTMQFANVKSSTTDLLLRWDNTTVALPISTDVDTKIMAQIKSQVEGDPRPYFAAAMYYLDNGKDLNKAIEWFDKALAQNPKAFWVYHQKANALAKQGKKQDAIASANKSIELAKEAKNDDYVSLNEKLLATLK